MSRGHKTDTTIQNLKVVFLWMYKCYIQEKIPWIEANYKQS